MKAMCWGALLSFVVFVCLQSPSHAGPITDEEKRLCKDDYHKFCGSYGPGHERASRLYGPSWPQPLTCLR
jgi:hypothetical protein